VTGTSSKSARIGIVRQAVTCAWTGEIAKCHRDPDAVKALKHGAIFEDPKVGRRTKASDRI
jgi:hypothetical protein